MRKNIPKDRAILLFAILFVGHDACALDWMGAAKNLTALEYAHQQAIFCSKQRPVVLENYLQWRKKLRYVEEKSLHVLNEYATSNKLNAQEHVEFIDSTQRHIRSKITSDGNIQRSNCKQFEFDLNFYEKQLID